MRIKHLVIAVLTILVLLASIVSPAFADEGKQKVLKVGDRIALETGEEAEIIGFDTHGNAIMTAKIGEPVYLPGTTSKYDTQWYLNDKGEFEAGTNTYEAVVSGTKVTVRYEGKQSNWNPTLSIDKSKIKEKYATPSLLSVDPINENYVNNTLMWDYGNGVRRYLRIIEGMLLEYYKIEYPLDADFSIDSNINKDFDFVWHRAPSAYDANYEPIDISYDNSLNIALTDEKAKKVKFKDKDTKYPITIDPDSTFIVSSSDGTIYSPYGDFGWAATRTLASGAWATSSEVFDQMFTGRISEPGGEVAINRAYLYFDTSALPDSAVITDTELWVHMFIGWNDDSTGVYIVEGMPTYPRDPLVVADFNYTYYDSFGANAGYNLTPSDGWMKVNNVNPNALKAVVNKTGYTKLALVERRDYQNEIPLEDEANWLLVRSYEYGVGYRPYLDVTFTATPPEILADDASNIGKTTARLNATVLDDGYEPCQIRWGYGTTSQIPANFAAYDTVTDWTVAEWTTGEHPYEDADTLASGTTHYYRIQIKNADSTVTSNEVNFQTETALNPPETLRAIPSRDSIKLSWVRGDGSSQTLVRYKSDDYPTTTTDGIQVYIGTGSVYELEGLVSGETYYFSAWGESGGGYSTTYTNAVTTTTAFEIDRGDDFDLPDIITGWFQPPDYTNLSNLEPIYSAVNGVSDSFGTPRNTVWMGLTLFIIALASIALMIKAGFVAGFTVGTIMMVLGVGVGILPAWMIFFMIVFGAAGWSMNKRGVSST